ncbi:tetraspanin-8-like [Brienomyrus brachyistius]|uniref:tetraspanin-8-like n=1 Tax=Brienomyrus brachyistius TaxID=42636 RepID=UPI0020B33728|nr:tetraspanin-8-like [Brienomyrus brachyistius]XP_048881339.1 tetraspanin-8-like [Brienomyrus brachyistius]XP_048881350.1 tetraspanin-8-like [Brienomyrus brachyistius]XP_048881360.1 tetraspanin-8-like [Brienomyrus brachyistius]
MAVNRCIKYSLFFFNLLFWVSGCVILSVSVYLKVTKDGNEITSFSFLGTLLLIAVGVVIMIFGFLGCCGAIRESRCMLLLFFIGLLVIFSLLLTAGILGVTEKDKCMNWIREKLEKLNPLENMTDSVQTDLQAVQEKGKCCGLVKGYTDWGTKGIPNSCDCKEESYKCVNVSEYRMVYETPCVEFVKTYLKQHLAVVLGVAFAIAVLMLFGMIFAMTLCCQIGKKETTGAQNMKMPE